MAPRIVIDGSAPAWAQNLELQLNKAFSQTAILGGVPVVTKTTLPPADGNVKVVIVTNDSGGTVLAFSDSIDWRRCTDRNIVS